MRNGHNDHAKVRELVIQAHPAARTTDEIVRQLSQLLPIESLDDFVRDARLSVAGEELRAEDLRPWLTEELFPVRDQKDLVEKTAAAVRVAGHILRRKKPRNPSEAHLRLVRELAGDEPQVGVGVFRGPSIFKVSEGGK
jgi:hypothetical protein